MNKETFNAFLTHAEEIHFLKQRVRTLEENLENNSRVIRSCVNSIVNLGSRMKDVENQVRLEEKDDPMMGFIADRDPGDENDTPRPTPYHQFDGNLNGY